MSNLPAARDRQHERTASWWPYRSGPQRVLAGTFHSERDAKAAESLAIASGRYLANIDENEWNPCRWYFGPPTIRQAPHRVRPVTRHRRTRRRWTCWKGRKPMIRRIVYALLLFSLVMFVYKNPGHAATAIKGMATAVATFVITLTS
jgi:hypothetical protein